MNEIEYVYCSDDRPWVIGYSGGKDSTLVVHLVYTMLYNLAPEKRKKTVYIVSSDTRVENPLIKEYLSDMLDTLREASKRDRLPIQVELVMPIPERSFWANVIGRGFPTPRINGTFRWCTDRLKIQPSGNFIEKIIEEQKTEGDLGYGPFTWETRQEILRKLLSIQKYMNYELISVDELKAIDRIWDDELDLSRRVLVNLYYEEMGEKLPWDNLKMPLFDDKVVKLLNCYSENYDISMELVRKLIFATEKNKHYSNPKRLREALEKELNQQWLHKEVSYFFLFARGSGKR